MKDRDILLRMEGISKSFPGVKALSDFSMDVYKGEVLSLMGGNGAGKSTLMKILSGAYRKDSGTIVFDGVTTEIGNPRVAEDLGISIIYQELNLLPSLTVAENIYIGRHPKTKTGNVAWRKMNRMAQEHLDALGIDLKAEDPVGTLSIARQQMVEIVKAVSRDSKLVIMDEPTSSLTDKEIKVLFQIIRTLKKKGVSIIFITHRLDEIFEISDRVTIMRDGQFVDTKDIKDITKAELITKMIGREMSKQFPERDVEIGEELLRVEDLSDGVKVSDISFTLHKGEVLGFAGLVGSGRTETMHTIFGSRKRKKGRVYLHGKQIDTSTPKKSIRNGIGLLTENRKTEGLVLPISVRENVVMVALDKVLSGGNIDRRKETKYSNDYVDALNIKTPSIEQKVMYLSGGNQQKVVLSKWLMSDSEVIIMDEPTRGIDVGAKKEIYDIINDMASQGKGIIVVSSESEEVMGICDRIIVMCEGRITGELKKEEFSQERIAALSVNETGTNRGIA